MHLPELPTEPRRDSGGAGGAARAELPPWHGQKVKVPARLWTGGHYSHAAVRFWAQLAALDRRAEGCRAGVITLAGYLGTSTRTAERYLAELRAPGPDGQAELSTVRHTHPGGTGATAERRTRRVTRTEHFAIAPVTAAKTLRPAAFVAYCVLAWAQAVTAPCTAAELAAALGLTARSARRLVDELDALGWLTVDRRDGHQGRHLITVHDQPAPPVLEDRPPPDTDGGSGADTDGGSLAIKEDAGLTDIERSTHRRGSFRRRRSDGKWVPTPVDNSPVSPVPPVPASVASVAPAALRPAARPAYAGPPLTLAPRVWAVLAPVHDLLPAASAFTVRRIGREIGRQLDTGVHPEDISDQLQRLRAWTPPGTLTDPGRWILGAALPARPGPCNTPDCVRGVQRYTGTPCKACADHTGRPRGHPPHPPAAAAPPPLLTCPGCHAPYRPPLRHPTCRLCHTDLPDTA